MRRFAALFSIFLLSACSSPPPPSGCSTDEIYKEQRAKRQSYTESTTITACSHLARAPRSPPTSPTSSRTLGVTLPDSL